MTKDNNVKDSDKNEKNQPNTTGANICPACGLNELDENQAMNALSRYVRGVYICSICGTREAFEGNFWQAKHHEA